MRTTSRNLINSLKFASVCFIWKLDSLKGFYSTFSRKGGHHVIDRCTVKYFELLRITIRNSKAYLLQVKTLTKIVYHQRNNITNKTLKHYKMTEQIKVAVDRLISIASLSSTKTQAYMRSFFFALTFGKGKRIDRPVATQKKTFSFARSYYEIKLHHLFLF